MKPKGIQSQPHWNGLLNTTPLFALHCTPANTLPYKVHGSGAVEQDEQNLPTAAPIAAAWTSQPQQSLDQTINLDLQGTEGIPM